MSVASKNLYALLGNDSDGEEKPVVPVKTVDKANPRTTKRNVVEPQAAPAPVRTGGNRRGGPSGNEGAFRDRGAGRERNQGRSTDEAPRDGPRGGSGARGRGGRGARFSREHNDRHPNKSGVTGSEKQAAQSWGATEGNAELKDEQAGEAIAETEQKDAQAEEAAPEEPAEPEDKSVSYADYLAQLAEKKLNLESELNVRAANEGSKLDKKWASAKPLEKVEDDYVSATYGKKQRERERKTKQTIDFDPRYVEPERTRGGGRGGGRGGPRGGRGGERGGDRPRGGPSRGGRGGGPGAPINTNDQSAFPSLGGN
ncbi:hypothetical protein PT974_08186 [Cladobotryum mycophilum]|uniref:Hyaluronan/mRNA-binding protein domain-containing protein n=1 Tax=Cladobotryum mycophilum TaxID=491253 RepID=A0ABR0SCR1_9HYPO